jgi:tight adherence protein B
MDLTALAIPALIFGAVASLVWALTNRKPGSSTLAQRLDRFTQANEPAPAAAEEGSGEQPRGADYLLRREQRYSNFALLDQMIARRSWAEREAIELTRADLPLRVGEYLMLRWLLAGAAMVAVLLVLHNIWLALPAGPIGYMAPQMWVKFAQRARRRKFEDQLVEAITLLASTLKSGYSFLQGMEAVAREMKPPISVEFDRLIKEIGVGARADEALMRLVERCRSEDLELVVTAIMVQRTVGGELAGILETIVRTVRERQRIKRDISTLTAQQRWSGYVIGALPIFLLVVISMGNPDYSGELLHTLHGQAMLAIATLMEVIGFFMIRRIIAIEV